MNASNYHQTLTTKTNVSSVTPQNLVTEQNPDHRTVPISASHGRFITLNIPSSMSTIWLFMALLFPTIYEDSFVVRFC